MKYWKLKKLCSCSACAPIIFSFLLLACGGGGGGGTPTAATDPSKDGQGTLPGPDSGGNPPGRNSGSTPGNGDATGSDPKVTAQSQGYVVINTEAGQAYRALDLATFSTVENIPIGKLDRASVGMAVSINQGTYDSALQVLTDLRPASLFYVEDGRFWLLPLNGTAADLVPHQVSSELAVDICAINPQTSIVNPSDGFIFVEIAGPDTDCLDDADNKRVAINLQLDSSTPAIDLTGALSGVDRVQAYEDFSKGGKIEGYIGQNKRTMVRFNGALDTPTNVFTATRNLSAAAYSNDYAGYVFFEADQKLHQYNFVTQHVSGPLFEFGPLQQLGEFFACDAQHCFFLNKPDLTTLVLLQLPLDGNSTAQQVASLNTADGTVLTSSMLLTRQFIYYVANSLAGDAQRLMRIAKGGGVPQEIDSAPSIMINNGMRDYNLDHVFYVKRDQVVGNANVGGTAVVRREDGAVVSEYTAATFVGFTTQHVNLVSHSTAGTILMVGNLPASTTMLGGGKLHAVNYADPSVTLELGTLPGYVQTLVAFGRGTVAQLSAVASEPPGRLITFAAKTDTVNSLKQISPEPGPNEAYFPL